MTKVMLVVCCVLLGAAAGCGGPAKPSNRIDVWHWMTDRQEALETLARRYEQASGVRVNIELFAPSDAYTQKIIAAAQAHVLPDVYGILDKKPIVAAFIKDGHVADLTPYFQQDNGAWEKSLFAKALEVNRFPEGNAEGILPGIYGVPIDVTSIQMVYNRALLRRAGLSAPPATFEEFLAAAAALRRVGVAPLVTGFGELWIVECVAFNYAFNIMGETKVLDTFRGKVNYTDADWVKVLRLFATMRAKGVFIEGIVTKGNKYAEQDFALGRAAFAVNGSWGVNVYREMNPDLDYGVAPLPAVNKKEAMRPWGGAGSSLVVNSHSPNREKAVAFLKWLTARDQQMFLAVETRNLPSNRDAMTDIPPLLADFARALDTSTHPNLWPVTEDPVVREVLLKGIQSIMIGEATPEKVAADTQKAKARQMKRRRP